MGDPVAQKKLGRQDLPQVGQGHAQAKERRPRRVLAPQQRRQLLPAVSATGLQREIGQQRAHLERPESVQSPTFKSGLEWP